MTDYRRPSWEEVMKPLADSPLWPRIRQAGSNVCEARLHMAGDFDSGISGSDINHTIFGTAQFVYMHPVPGGSYAAAVLNDLESEYEGSR